MQKNVKIVYFYGPKKGHGAPPKYFYKCLNCLISSNLVSYISNSIKKNISKRIYGLPWLAQKETKRPKTDNIGCI